MNRIYTVFFSLILILLGTLSSNAQRNCSAMDVLMENIQRNPELMERMMEIESHTAQFLRNDNAQIRNVIRIPVVVHVVYRTSTENISDAQIQSQINVLNQDFRRTNTDRTTRWSQAADSEIEFCLATVDPSGNPTTGITRTATSVSGFSTNDAMKYNNQGGKDAWPTDKYLNIWVCNMSGGILGYAQFPGGGAYATDGVVVGHSYFGTSGTATAPFNKGRTATHEVGHWLNLRHIWGDGACGTDDFISDTPESDAANYGCATGHISCSTTDMVENYMDYSDDACMNLFTLGQKSRMRALFASGGFRVGLLTSNGCGSSGSTTTNYCASNATNNSYEWIANVKLGTINNTSTASSGGYGNFTAISTDLTKGSSATITLTPGFSGSTYTEYFKVYIDLNGDKDFDDAGENVFTSAGVTAATSGSFTIPTTAISGTTRMRIVMKDGTISGPCTTFTYGEVEDYSVNIKDAVSCNAPTSLSVSGISSSGATLSWGAVSGASGYTLQVKPSTSTSWTSYSVSGSSTTVSGLAASTTYNWQVRTNCSGATSNYSSGSNFTTTAATSSCSDNYESNNTLSAAKSIAVNTNITARIGTSTDVDWFKFSNSSTARNIRVTMTNLPFDYDLYLYNSAGTLLYKSENGGTSSETITYNGAPLGTYYIRVIGYNNAFSSSSCYTLRATRSSSTLRLADEETFIISPKEESPLFEDLAATFDVSLFPNPATDILNIQVTSAESAIKGQAFDAMGRLIWTGYLENGVNSISVYDLPAGIYHFVAIQNNGERISRTFVRSN
jgi:hypothetical protein